MAPGEAVRDLQRRLAAAGFTPGGGEARARTAPPPSAPSGPSRPPGPPRSTACCDEQTWAALVEAGWGLGDRLPLPPLAQCSAATTSPSSSATSGALGFDAGRVDGIFGPLTARGARRLPAQRRPAPRRDLRLRDASTPCTASATGPAAPPWRPSASRGSCGGPPPDAGRAPHRRRRARRSGSMCRAVAKTLRRAGAHGDDPRRARRFGPGEAANRFDADLYLGLALADGATTIALLRRARLRVAGAGTVWPSCSTSAWRRRCAMAEAAAQRHAAAGAARDPDAGRAV